MDVIDQTTKTEADRPNGIERRGIIRRAGAGVAGAAALGALGATGLVAGTKRAAAAGITDVDILNFALNLEYLEAEYYLRAVTGRGLASYGLTPNGAGTVTAPSNTLVPFQNAAIAYYAQRIANDEVAHVRFLTTALGSSAVAEPNIDLMNSFTTLAIAAGLIVPGQTFNPFASEVGFLLGAYIFEDVGVTAYAGAASSLTNPNNVSYAASILAVEGYHAGALRGYLSDIGGGTATNAISALRQKLGTVQDNGTNYNGNAYNITNVDVNAQAFRRTPQQVLSIVYGGGTNSGLFYPNGVNGTVTMA